VNAARLHCECLYLISISESDLTTIAQTHADRRIAVPSDLHFGNYTRSLQPLDKSRAHGCSSDAMDHAQRADLTQAN